MDRRQMVVQRVRDLFADRLEDVREMVRQDRQDLRSWQEPAHIRGVLRRRESRDPSTEYTLGKPATEQTSRNTLTAPISGYGERTETVTLPTDIEQASSRESTCQLLDSGAAALEKITRGPGTELNTVETLGLEFVLLLYARPAIAVSGTTLGSVPPFWNLLEDQREDIEQSARGVGRIELLGHPEYDWAGTGFLVSDSVLMTTRRTAELFIEQRNNSWQFRPGISTWMNYRSSYQDVASAGYRVRGVIGVHDSYDLALLEVERPPTASNGSAPVPLSLAMQAPMQENPLVYLIGYPVRDARRNEPEGLARIFREVYNVKRVQPGQLRGELTYHEVTFLRHDAAPLGQNAGAPIVDLETHQVVGMQSTGRYLETNGAVPLYLLRDDPMLRQAGVNFAEATPRDRQGVLEQVERLARSRYWGETRSLIAGMYQRAFGTK